MRVGLCPACGHVVAVSGGPRFYQVHDHRTDGEPLAFAWAAVSAVAPGGAVCVGSGDYVPAHRTRHDDDATGAR